MEPNTGDSAQIGGRIASEFPKDASAAMASATAKGFGIPAALRPFVVAGGIRAARWLFAFARRHPVPALIIGGAALATFVYKGKAQRKPLAT